MLHLFSQYYYLVFILQGICLFHSVRRGTHNKWLFIILFLPFVGSLIYLYAEVLTSNHVSSVQTGVASVINPGGKIRALEQQFNFSDTFANRRALLEAYFEKNMYAEAIALYEPALGVSSLQDEEVINSLIQAYYNLGNYQEVVKLAEKVKHSIGFSKSPQNSMYAVALEEIGQFDEAENEYKKMNHRFLNYETRLRFGVFLEKRGRPLEALELYKDIVSESQHLSRGERNAASAWIRSAKDQMARVMKSV